MSAKPTDEPLATATAAELSASLLPVLADGLPVTQPVAGELLLRLRSVYARAVVPSDSGSRLAALNELLPRLIAGLADATFREAVQILFGLAPGTRGAGLMDRRRQAASILGYSPGHFRNEIEQKLMHAVAVAIHDDLLRYRIGVNRSVESLEPTGSTPRIGPEHFTHEEELVSRIWQHVYGLRAEVIAKGRLEDEPEHAAAAEEHRQAALLQQDALRDLLREYADTYGGQHVRHGDTEYNVEALARLTSWRLPYLSAWLETRLLTIDCRARLADNAFKGENKAAESHRNNEHRKERAPESDLVSYNELLFCLAQLGIDPPVLEHPLDQLLPDSGRPDSTENDGATPAC